MLWAGVEEALVVELDAGEAFVLACVPSLGGRRLGRRRRRPPSFAPLDLVARRVRHEGVVRQELLEVLEREVAVRVERDAVDGGDLGGTRVFVYNLVSRSFSTRFG